MLHDTSHECGRCAPLPFTIEDGRRTRWRMAFQLALTDIITLFMVISAVTLLRFALGGTFSLRTYMMLLPLLPLFPTAFLLADLYPGALLPPHEELRRFCITISTCFLILGTITFFARGVTTYSRTVFVFSWLLAMVAIPLMRVWLRGRQVRRGRWGIPAVLIGTGAPASIMTRNAQLRPRIGLRVVGVLSNTREQGSEFEGIPVLGSLADVQSVANAYPGSYALVPEQGDQPPQSDIMSQLDRLFPRIILLPRAETLSQRWASTRDIGGVVGLELRQNLLSPRRLLFKRGMDISVAALGLLLLSPFFLMAALWIRLDSRGPAFFGHTRIGRNGKAICVWKFRTMTCDGDSVLNRHFAECPDARTEWEATQKLQNDPRVTKAGRFLRKTSLDELPQLWNVLWGDLSLVGPRPIVRTERCRYRECYDLYSRTRPGITGLWQISGRNLTSYDQRIDLDAYYVRNWSIWFDLYILVKTIPVVLTGRGAY